MGGFYFVLFVSMNNLDLLFSNSIIYDAHLFIDYKERMNTLFHKNYCFIITVFAKNMIKYSLKNLQNKLILNKIF